MLVKQNNIRILIASALVFMGCVIFFLVSEVKIGVNITDSMPDRLYFYKKYDGHKLSSGDIVTFPLPVEVPKEYPFHKNSMFVKNVACNEGSYIRQVENEKNIETYCDNKLVAVAIKKDKLGNKMDVFHYEGRVPQDMYFLNTTHPFSFDSRYYGFIHKSQITGFVIKNFPRGICQQLPLNHNRFSGSLVVQEKS